MHLHPCAYAHSRLNIRKVINTMNIFQLRSKRDESIRKAETILTSKGANSAEYKDVKADIDSMNELIQLQERAGINTSSAPAPTPAPIPAPTIITVTSEARAKKVTEAARQFFRHGMNHVNQEQRDLLTTGDTIGGALNSQFFDDVFQQAAKYYGPVWTMVNRKDDAVGNPAKFPVTSDVDRTFSLATEGTTSALSVNQDPIVFSDVINTDTILSAVVYSRQEVEDAYDLEAWLMSIAGTAVSRAWEHAVTLSQTNDGTNTALPSSTAGGLLAVAAANPGVTQTTGTLAAGITTANLQALAGSVDRAYYQNGSFMASPSVETFLRSQVDSTGRQLYCIDPNTGYLIIAGRPLVPNVAMPANGTASKPLVIFGDYSKAWNVLNAGLRLKVISSDGSPVLAYNTRELIMWSRLGQSAGVSNAVASLISAAS
jgi:HK97 family phage major capsid protein